MVITKSEEKARYALSLIGGGIEEEILRLAASRRMGASGIREIVLRSGGRSSVLFEEERIVLYSTLSPEQTEALLTRLCEGAMYAYRDSISLGYITLKGGIRVGVGGYAKYEHRSFVGVSDIRSLVFRIPGHACSFADELERVYRESPTVGMLIYSPPGVGKTTALRSLAARLGSGKDPRRIAVVDERCEFDGDDYRDCEVDVLKGYKRKRGIEIATRTLSPQLVMIDEIGSEDAYDVASVVKCGIPLIATAHAASYREICEKPSLKPLMDIGVFDLFVGISKSGGKYELSVDRI